MRGILLLLSLVLSACGGGGEPDTPLLETQTPAVTAAVPPSQATPTTSPAQEPTAPQGRAEPVSAADIAAWGDSLMVPLAGMLPARLPGRTVFNGGVGGQSSTQIAARQGDAAAAPMREWITVLWMGRNNISGQEQVLSDIAACVARLGNNHRFVVLSVPNSSTPAEQAGGSGYAKIMSLNAALAAAYPENYLDVRAYLVGQYNPALPQDVIDRAADVPPSSLRRDALHLNNEGTSRVSKVVADFILHKGW